MAYPNTDVFILCFSVVDPDSYSNILGKWIPELNRTYQIFSMKRNETVGLFRLCTSCTNSACRY
jgi:GTPase SAR1 family protein